MDDKIPDIWKSVGERHELCKTRVFRVMSEPFRCPRTDVEHEYITLDCPDWVNVVAVTPDKKLVMIRQFRHGTRRIELEIPAGTMEHGDADPIEAALRELREETGYTGENARKIGEVCPNPTFQGNTMHIVMVENAVPSGETDMDDTEDISTVTVSLDELISKIHSGEMKHALMIDAIFFYLLTNNTLKFGE